MLAFSPLKFTPIAHKHFNPSKTLGSLSNTQPASSTSINSNNGSVHHLFRTSKSSTKTRYTLKLNRILNQSIMTHRRQDEPPPGLNRNDMLLCWIDSRSKLHA